MAEEEARAEFVTEQCPIKPRKIGPQNIVVRLRRREMFGCRYPGTHVLVARQFYQNVFPNFTVVNVEKPPCFLRKFSPDGRYLVAFSSDQTSIKVYEYRGASAAAALLAECKGEYVGHKNDQRTFQIRSNVFNCFFKVSTYLFIMNRRSTRLRPFCSHHCRQSRSSTSRKATNSWTESVVCSRTMVATLSLDQPRTFQRNWGLIFIR